MEAFDFKVNNKTFSRQKAYTIKELAITFCVLGITICSILISMLHRVQAFVLKQEFKKQFSIVSQAYENLRNDQGGDLTNYFTTGQSNATVPLTALLENYIEYKKACGIGGYYTFICGYSPATSLEKAYKTLTGKIFNGNNLIQGQYLLKDGANMYFRASDSQYLLIFVDVNGFAQGPNVFGEDLLGITVAGNRVFPMGTGGTGVEGTCVKKVEPHCGHGFYCPTEDISGASCAVETLYK